MRATNIDTFDRFDVFKLKIHLGSSLNSLVAIVGLEKLDFIDVFAFLRRKVNLELLGLLGRALCGDLRVTRLLLRMGSTCWHGLLEG